LRQPTWYKTRKCDYHQPNRAPILHWTPPEICIRLDATDEQAFATPRSYLSPHHPHRNMPQPREQSRAELNTSPGSIQPQFPFCSRKQHHCTPIPPLCGILTRFFIAALSGLCHPRQPNPKWPQIPARSCNTATFCAPHHGTLRGAV
jgi:hypothetical protein